MSDDDIVAVLRECAADWRATEGVYYADQFATAPEIFERAAAEISRLRLTDAERESIHEAAVWYEGVDEDERCHSIAATLRGMLERLGP